MFLLASLVTLSLLLMVSGISSPRDNGTTAILTTNFAEAPAPMFDRGPGCFLHCQASFIINFFPEDLEVGVDIGYFYLPPIDAAYGKPVLGSGSLLSMAVDNEAVREVMKRKR